MPPARVIACSSQCRVLRQLALPRSICSTHNRMTFAGPRGPLSRHRCPTARQRELRGSGSSRSATSWLTTRNASCTLRIGGLLSSLLLALVSPTSWGKGPPSANSYNYTFNNALRASFTALRSDPNALKSTRLTRTLAPGTMRGVEINFEALVKSRFPLYSPRSRAHSGVIRPSERLSTNASIFLSVRYVRM
jgi:hypothetical protein